MLYVKWPGGWLWDRDIGLVERGLLCVREDIWALEKRAIAVGAAGVQ